MSINTSYRRDKGPSLILLAKQVHTAMPTNPAFTGSVPDNVPLQGQFKSNIDAYEAAFEAALTKELSKVQASLVARTTLISDLDHIADFLNFVGKTNPEVLINTGFAPKKAVARHVDTTGFLFAPAKFELQHGRSGVIVAKCSRLHGAGSYDVYFCEGYPTGSEAWKHKGVYVSCSHMELTGLIPGTVYSFMVRGIGAKGPGAWSTVVTMMAI